VISAGQAGQHRVTRVTIYENGHKAGSEIVSDETIKEPTPKRVAVGIR
jgi:uncharacterized protein YabE (DUF348 family)